MSKRNKKSRSNRSTFKIEALEQRQLLASITGDGTEVNTDVFLAANNNTYDQVLMTGSSVTVTADAGQVTRIDFLDADGDIVRAEFAGSGTLTISLADFKAAATPTEYATDTKYVQGNASFRIEGSDATTNFSLHSLGTANVHNGLANPIFADGTKDGGNNTANAARLVIEASDSALGSAFGGIRAGNAVFSDSAGAVGIVAPDIQFQGPIIIGDISATGNAIPVIQLGQFSANKTVQIAGGDLKLGNASLIQNENVSKLVSSSGQTSMGVLLSTQALTTDGTVFQTAIAAKDVSYTSAAAKVVVDGKTVTAEQLTAYSKMYLNEVELVNWEAGDVFSAHLIGNVTVTGDLGGTITTDVANAGVSDANEFSIGNVTITGKLLGTGKITSSTSVGNVSVEKGVDLTAGTDAAGATLISTIGRADQSSAIGTLTFGGDVKLGGAGDNPILAYSGTDGAAANGGIGAISVTGELSRTDGASTVFQARTGNIGNISASKKIDLDTGNLVQSVAGSVGNISASSIDLVGSILAHKGVGNISSTGSASGDNVTLGIVTSTEESIGTITSNKNISLAGVITAAKNIGAVNAGGTLTTSATVTATDGSIASITAGGTVTIGAAVGADSIGDITVNGKNSDLLVNAAVSTDKGNIGNISVTGEDADIIFTGAGGFSAGTKAIGNISVASGVITGTVGTVEFGANVIGDVSVKADKASAGSLLSNVVFKAHGIDKASTGSAKIGNITLDTTAKAALNVATGEAADAADKGTGFSSSGNIGNITINMGEGTTGKLTATTGTGLVFRAGSSAMGDNITGSANGQNVDAAVTIGNVDIRGNLAGLGSGADGTGLVIAAGVDPIDAGRFASGDTGNVTAASKVTTALGTIGTVRIESYTGAESKGFTGSTLTTTITDTEAGSVIVADKIGNVTIVTGSGSEVKTPSGLPLKGSIDVGVGGTDTDDLYVVVL